MKRLLKLIIGASFTLLCLCAGITAEAETPSVQGDFPKVSINVKGVPVKTVLTDVESQAGCSFVYSSDIVDIGRTVSLDMKNVTVEAVLQRLFRGTDVSWTTDGQLITLVKKSSAFTGRITVRGKITDSNGNPLAGVMVSRDMANYTISDANGHYAIEVADPKAVLHYSCMGMEDVNINVGGQSNLDVVMPVASYLLDEIKVVSVGYGTMRKKDLTGAVASVSGETITSLPASGVSESLQGRLAGVEVRSVSAEPGASVSIRVRGTNSIKGGNDPLWIVDGFPGMPNMLNTSDIESVEVLKDASATAIYGSRGSNGVIIVTTRQGQEGKTSVDYNGSVGVSLLGNKLDMMDATEYMKYQNIISRKEYFSEDEIASAGTGTDWQDLIFRPAVTNNHAVSVNAGLRKTRISAGASLFDQEGIIRGSSYTKGTFRLSFNHDISRIFSLSANAIYSRTLHYKQGGLLSMTLKATPTLDPYQEDGTYTSLRDYYPFSPSGLKNPEAMVNEREYKWTSNRTMVNAALTAKPVKGLAIRAAFNANVSNARQDNYISTKYPESLGEISITSSEGMGITGEVTATYSLKLDKHSFSIMAGSTYEQETSKSLSASATGLKSDVAGIYGLSAAENKGTPESGYSKWSMLSFIGRLNYSYADRYLATVNFRADGSSRYSKGHKWGVFPSIALAWRVSEEGFMENVSFINNLKLRLGYGQTGNPAISPYQTLDLLTPQPVIFGKDAYVAQHPSSSYRFGLLWETTGQYNAGIDLGLLRDRIRITADYYHKTTWNLLNTVDFPGSSGYTNGTKNIGTMLNYGFELQIDTRVIDTRNFKWDLSGNISINRNRVLELPNGEDVYGTKRSIVILNDYINILREGYPIGTFYGYEEDGYDDRGRIKYIDHSNDGKVNENDKVVIGDPNPDFTFGFTTDFTVRRFTLSAYFQGSYGNDIYSLSMASQCYNYSGSRGINTLSEVLYNYWTEDNPNSKYPALNAAATSSLKMSDRYVYDGSYIRLKNLSLTYRIPVEKVKWLKGASVYVSGQNLLTFTKYPFIDPDVNTYGGSSSVNQGIDDYSYPYARSFTFGVKLNF